MIYHQRNKKSPFGFGFKLIVAIIVVLIALRLFGVNLTDGYLKNALNYVLESKSAMLAPARGTLFYFKSKSGLEEDRKRLLAENTKLKIDLLTNQAVSQEFESYKTQFGQAASGTKPVKVILKPPFMPFDILRLSGDLAPYAEGNYVFYQNVIVGTLVEKTGRYGSVELFSTPNRVTPASVKGTQFEAKGLGGGRYVIEVSKEFELAEGDPILYPSEQVVLLGVVEQVESAEEDLFKKIYFNLPVPLDSVTYVSIGTIAPPPATRQAETVEQETQDADTESTD